MRVPDQIIENRLIEVENALKERPWTPQELADRFGLTVRSIYRYLVAVDERTGGEVKASTRRPTRYSLPPSKDTNPRPVPAKGSKSKIW